jgi:hypothetical protein
MGGVSLNESRTMWKRRTSDEQCSQCGLLALLVVPAAFYLVFFCLMTFPLVGRFSTHFFLDAGDGLQNVWNLWWVNEAVTRLHVLPWYTTYLHHPHGITLLGHTLNPFNGFVGIALLPILTLTQTVNTMVVFSFVSAGVTAFWLTWRLTRSYGGSLLAGFVFTFSSYHWSHAQGHLQLVSLEWIPLFLLSWVALVERPRWPLAIGSALALFLILLCDYYYFFYCVLTGTLILLWRWRRDAGLDLAFLRERLPSLGVFALTALLTSGWIVLSLLYANARDPMGGVHATSAYSMDLLSPIVHGGHWRFGRLTVFHWARLPGNIHESSVHLGLSVILILVLLWRRRGAVRDESLRLWYAILLIFLVLSLGPTLRVFGVEVPFIALPYRALEMVLPPLRLSGVPVRMMVMVTLCAGILCGMAWKLFAEQERKGRKAAILLLLVLYIEYLPTPIPTTRIEAPAWVHALAALPGQGAVVIANEVAFGSLALYFQTIHGRPMAFGYVSRTPASVSEKDSALLALIDERRLETLHRDHAIRYLVIDSDQELPSSGYPESPVVFEDTEMRIHDLGLQ